MGSGSCLDWKILINRLGGSSLFLISGFVQFDLADKKVALYLALALNFDRLTFFEPELVGDQLVGGFGDLYNVGNSVLLHAAGHVDSVTPQVVTEFGAADNTGDDRAAIDADTHHQRFAAGLGKFSQRLLHVDGQVSNSLRMVWAKFRRTTDDHVSIANGFNFFYTILLGQCIKTGKHLIEQIDQIIRRHAGRDTSEFNQIGKHNGDRIKAVCNPALVLFEAVGDRFWQDVEIGRA